MLRRTCTSLSRARASRSGEKEGYTLVRTGIFGGGESSREWGEESKQPRPERAEQSDGRHGSQKRPQHAHGTRYNASIRLQKAPIDAAHRTRCSWTVYVRGLDPGNRIGRQKAALDAHHVRLLANPARAPWLRISWALPPPMAALRPFVATAYSPAANKAAQRERVGSNEQLLKSPAGRREARKACLH